MNDSTHTEVGSLLEAILPTDGVAVLYGSCRPEADVDVLFVQESPPAAPFLMLGRLDVTVLSCREANKLADVLDPLVVEPILTGRFIHGNRDLYRILKDRVGGSLPSSDAVEHLSRRCFEELVSAERILREWDTQQSEVCRWAFQNLSYSISYGSFARHYSCPDARLITLDELIDRASVSLPEFWRCRREMKQANVYPPAAVNEWLTSWKRALLQTG